MNKTHNKKTKDGICCQGCYRIGIKDEQHRIDSEIRLIDFKRLLTKKDYEILTAVLDVVGFKK